MSKVSDDNILDLLALPATRDKGFALLMDTYKERIYWHIRRLVVSHEDAEDILQETFINAYRYAGSFNRKSSLFTWLYKIATNESVRMFRKLKIKKGKVQITTQLSKELIEHEPVNGTEILIKFQQAILSLPEKQRIVFNLRYYDELDYEEISKILNSSTGALKTNYHYANERIKEFLIYH
jgi:RNA polymerase sigma-70 factor, ECF subfamily